MKVHQLNSSWSEAKKVNFVKHALREYRIHRYLPWFLATWPHHPPPSLCAEREKPLSSSEHDESPCMPEDEADMSLQHRPHLSLLALHTRLITLHFFRGLSPVHGHRSPFSSLPFH